MTLILSAISPRWTMQASDRKVVGLNASGEVVTESTDRNKAIFVAERLSFAYTGHADIGGTDTADWFQGQLARSIGRGHDITEALNEVADMTAQYFRALPPYIDERHHAYVGVGWTEGDIHSREPLIICLSNAIDSDGTWRETVGEEFLTYREILRPTSTFSLLIAGAPVSDEAAGRLYARIDSQLATNDDPAPVARILIETIRAEADRNRSIGKGVMLTCLPIAPGPPTGDVIMVGGWPKRDVRTFTYVPEGSWDGRYLGPLVVGSDGSQSSGFVAQGPGITLDGGSAGFVYRPASSGAPPRAAVGQRIREYRIGRNDPCWCGSGKKHKKCHGAEGG